MGHYKIKYSSKAENDLRDIGKFITEQSHRQTIADKQLDIIKNAAAVLSLWPERGRVYDKELGYRIMTVKKIYVILYSINKKKEVVMIEHIFHGRRDWQRLMKF